VLESGQLNTRDVLVSDRVVFTQEALDSFVARTTGAAATQPAPAGNARSAAADATDTAKPAAAKAEPAPESDEPKPKASRAKAKQEDSQ